MDFGLTDELISMRDSARKFADDVLTQKAREMDAAERALSMGDRDGRSDAKFRLFPPSFVQSIPVWLVVFKPTSQI